MRFLIFLLLLSPLIACVKHPTLSEAVSPVPGPAKAIGSYSNGCLVGAASLPPDGMGYQFMRLTRRRFYGHPQLVDFIAKLAQRNKEADKTSMLLVGDMAQPRGGKIAGGHDSHQTGLDVDIWYWHPVAAETHSLTLDERESLSALSVLDKEKSHINPLVWNSAMAETLHRAASFPEIERIFVHPVVKQTLCKSYKGEAWLQKIRPWWGHDDHFHVRLRCPVGDTSCIAQKTPLPAGDGCDATLDWWFTKEAQVTADAKAAAKKIPVMPEACKAL